jgi:MFS family permease
MMGIYYSAPLLGPSLGPIIGGALTQAFEWRAVFWFLMILGGVSVVAFLCFFKDTFRKERSVAYQNVLKRRVRERLVSEAKDESQEISENDVEAQRTVIPASASKKVNLSITDVNPFPPYISILRRKNNLAILVASGKCPQ